MYCIPKKEVTANLYYPRTRRARTRRIGEAERAEALLPLEVLDGDGDDDDNDGEGEGDDAAVVVPLVGVELPLEPQAVSVS